jgi:hypothetical protein
LSGTCAGLSGPAQPFWLAQSIPDKPQPKV